MSETELDDEEPVGEFVNPKDLTHQRDGEGNRLAQTKDVGKYGKMRFMPMNYGDVQDYLGDGTSMDVEAEAIARLLDDFVLEPDLSKAADQWARDEPGQSPKGRVTPEYVESFKPLVPRDIMLALFDASGIDAEVIMEGPGQAQVNVQGN